MRRGLILGLLWMAAVVPPAAQAAQGTAVESSEWIVFLPSEMRADEKYPLVVALPPDGNARAAAELWREPAEANRWIVAGSKSCRNDMKFTEILPMLAAFVEDVSKRYPVDTSRIVVSGFAGGGMAAHAYCFTYPTRCAAVAVNTAMIHPSYTEKIAAYPHNKLAVLLASPTDFRFEEMQQDRKFLENLGWTVQWFEFDGGHVPAPGTLYGRAASWLDPRLSHKAEPGPAANDAKPDAAPKAAVKPPAEVKPAAAKKAGE